MIVCYCVCIGLICLYWALCVFQNKKQRGLDTHARNNEEAIQELLDETDFQQEGFFYTT
jgi:MFS transporter, ACS family, allantoate permease